VVVEGGAEKGIRGHSPFCKGTWPVGGGATNDGINVTKRGRDQEIRGGIQETSY